MENRFSLPKKLLIYFSFALSMILTPAAFYAGQQPPAMPDLSPQQMEEMQQELAKINEEMQAFVKTLPPEKQQEIAELEEAINQMSDEELEGLFEQLFTDENFLKELEQMYPEQPMQPEPIAPEPVYEPIAKPIEKPITKPRVEKNRITLAAEMIGSLSDVTETFLAKLDTVPEIDDIVTNWLKKRRLKGWRQNTAWDVIKSQIDLFNQKLNKLLQKDPDTNEYLFLPDLVDSESVYNNLAHMESVLKRTVPKIEVAVFGLKKLSTESKESMQAALNKYAEGMSELQLIPAINTIIEKYEPIAKQMRDKEESLSKNAFEESKKPRTEKAMVIAGKPEARPSVAKTSYEDYGYYPSSGYNPSYTPSYSPETSPEQSGFGEKPGAGGSMGGGAGGKAGAKAGDKGKDKDGKDKNGKDKGDKENKDKGKGKDKDKKPGSFQEKFTAVEKKLKAADMASGDHSLVQMRQQVSIHGSAPKGLDGILQSSISKINEATGAVNDLGKSLADQPEKTKKEYKGKVKSAYSKQMNLGLVDRQLQAIKSNWVHDRNKMNQAKLDAYGINFDAPQAPESAQTQMDAESDQDGQDIFEEVTAQARRHEEAAGLSNGVPAPAAARSTSSGQATVPAHGARAPGAHAPAGQATPTEQEIKAEFERLMKEQEKKSTPQNIYDALEALKQSIEKLAK